MEMMSEGLPPSSKTHGHSYGESEMSVWPTALRTGDQPPIRVRVSLARAATRGETEEDRSSVEQLQCRLRLISSEWYHITLRVQLNCRPNKLIIFEKRQFRR